MDGILQKLIQKQFGIKTRLREDVLTSSLGVAAERVIPQNSNRLGWIIINLSTNTVYVGFNNGVSATNGIILVASGGSYSMIWNEDFDVVGYEIWGIASAAASAIKCYEIIGVGEVK